ncbi:MAG: glycosyltransferase / methyltransferase [Mucilaginibacter sp.]|nr:glycosyltransferase / methyltransferase [Mucilaginibacter sp.]
MKYPRISIITPSYNQSAYLSETIESIISQNYPNLEYIVIDGGSTDGSIDILKKYDKYISHWVSEKDEGMYHALQKGFELSTGEIMGWLNADDLLHRKSLFALANIFTSIPNVNWLQGRPTVYDESGMTVGSSDPITSKYEFYLKKHELGKFIQQESTYWRRDLWERSGGYISKVYSYAGDFELWMRFFLFEPLFSTSALIGGYRVRKTQLSRVFFQQYIIECNTIIDGQKLSKKCQKHLQWMRFIEKYLFKIKPFKLLFDNYYQSLFGLNHLVQFDFESGRFFV